MTVQSHPSGKGGPERAPLSSLASVDIGHATHVALVDADTAFWGLVRKERAEELRSGGELAEAFRQSRDEFAREMNLLRFGLKPSAVYFNPTERCNLNCGYCYIPEDMRRSGSQMSRETLLDSLETLHRYFRRHMPEDRLPQVIFHGAEPLLARDAVFAGIEAYGDRFRFGVQTNATMLDEEAIAFLTGHGVGIGLSLDGPLPEIANRTRKRWTGEGVFDAVVKAIDRLKGYPGFNVICTMTEENLPHLTDMVSFLHDRHVPACMLNVTRCTQPRARKLKGGDQDVAKAFLAALRHTHDLYRKTGRKIVVANFANILIAILAPTARRLMCDISPCGGGRSFFALAPNGDMFPCSEFIGLPEFNGGNLFRDQVDDVLKSKAFLKVIERKVEDIEGCDTCNIRHFCGSPCPAEAHEMNGGMKRKGAFCEFYEEQVAFAFRLIADGIHGDYLWEGWDEGTKTLCEIGAV